MSLLTDAQWAAFTSKAVGGASIDHPLLYRPPQLQPDTVSMYRVCFWNCYTTRSPFCVSPIVPCCGQACCFGEMACQTCCTVQVEKISEPTDWFKKMLSVKDPLCPKELEGIFW